MLKLDEVAEVEFWRKVIKQAFEDAGITLTKGQVSNNNRSVRSAKELSNDQAQAINFLTAISGEWKESREFICSLAMTCPNRLRSYYLTLSEPQDNKKL